MILYKCDKCPNMPVKHQSSGSKITESQAYRISKDDSNNLFAILAHDFSHRINSCTKEEKTLKKTPTSYRDDYCLRRKLPKRPASCRPFPRIMTSDEKFSTNSIYSGDFIPYSEKHMKSSRGNMVIHEDHLAYPAGKFMNESETKYAFQFPKVKHIQERQRAFSLKNKGGNFINRLLSGDAEVTYRATTYDSHFKIPKNFERSKHCHPKDEIQVSVEPFKNYSQYATDFKKPQKPKKYNSEFPHRGKQKYYPPTIAMESKTTYRAAFNKTAQEILKLHSRMKNKKNRNLSVNDEGNKRSSSKVQNLEFDLCKSRHANIDKMHA